MKISPLKFSALLFILISLQLIYPLGSHAELYECSDERGNVTHHSQSPCPEGYSGRLIQEEEPPKANQNTHTSPVEAHKGKNVEVITRGRLVDLINHIDYGKYTVFMFYADWCAPCKTVKPELEEKAKNLDTFSLKELDVLTWDNPLVKYYNLGGLPYFIVYGPGGEFVERGPVLSKDFMSKITKAD